MYTPIPFKLKPYPFQTELLRAVRDGKNVCSVVHRRAGKDTISIQCWLLRGLARVGTHIYLLPLQTQARQIVWQGMDYSGFPFIEYIPKWLIKNKNEARMEITLLNGSVLKLGGSNNFNGMMGSNPVTIIYSEYSLHNPLARQYLNPILVQNGGLEIAQFTPRGMNHGFDLLQAVIDNPRYFTQTLGVEQTKDNDGNRLISAKQIEEARKMGMSDEMIRQEFYVDFEVGNMGAYFTREISDMVTEGRITNLAPNPALPLHTAWDLGGTDATACWLFQLEGNFIHLLDIIHDSGHGLKYYLEKAEQIRKSFQCRWGNHFMPHDVQQGHQGWEHVESRLMTARKHGWNFMVTPKVNFEDGIEAMRFALPKVRINKMPCEIGIRALREYQRQYDEVRACYKSKPLDNWATHIVDALRYLSINHKRLYAIPMSPKQYKTSL